MKPHSKVEMTTQNKTDIGLNVKVTTSTTKSVFDVVHPNCLTFAESGRMFIGDSTGTISVWDVSLRYGNLVAENHFKIMSKELEGDEINEIRVHPEHTN